MEGREPEAGGSGALPRQSPLAINQRPPPPALRRPPTFAGHLQDNGVSTGDVRDITGMSC